jgi:2-iminobutanoate/2-iminopropanoate deaminase
MSKLKREVIKTKKAGIPPNVPLSQAIKVGNMVYLSSTLGMNPKTLKVEGKNIEEQTRDAINNCREVLKAAGATLEDVVRVVVLLKNPEDFDKMNNEYAKHFRRDPPSRTVVKIGAQMPNVLISIMMDAVITKSRER